MASSTSDMGTSPSKSGPFASFRLAVSAFMSITWYPSVFYMYPATVDLPTRDFPTMKPKCFFPCTFSWKDANDHSFIGLSLYFFWNSDSIVGMDASSLTSTAYSSAEG